MTIYGECIGTRERLPVIISELCDSECEIELQSATAAIDELLDLWIGAIGPLPVTAHTSGERRYRARFREPLDQRIIAHFAVS